MSRRPPNCPPDIVITCGPFAESASFSVESPTPRRQRLFREKAAVDSALPAWDSGSPTSVSVMNHGAATGGVAQIVGSDVSDRTPPPSVPPMNITSGGDGNTKGGLPKRKGSAADVVKKVLLSRGKKPSLNSTPESKQPPADEGVRPRAGDPADKHTAVAVSPGNMNHQSGNDPSTQDKVAGDEGVLKLIEMTLLEEPSRNSVIWLSAIEKLAQAAARVPSDGIAPASILADPESHPAALEMILSSAYASDWLEWDLEVVKETVRQDFGVEMPDDNMNKVAAVGFIARSPADFFLDWNAFEKICLALNGKPPRIGSIADLDPSEMVFALSCVSILRKSLMQDGFGAAASDKVKAYCAARLFEAGLVVSPPSLQFADELILKMAPHIADLAKKSMSLYNDTMEGKEAPVSGDDIPPPEYVQVYRLMKIAASVMDKNSQLISTISSMSPVVIGNASDKKA